LKSLPKYMDPSLRNVMRTPITLKNTVPGVSMEAYHKLSPFERMLMRERMRDAADGDRRFRARAAATELESRREGFDRAVAAMAKSAEEEPDRAKFDRLVPDLIKLAATASLKTVKGRIVSEYVPLWRKVVSATRQEDELVDFLTRVVMQMKLNEARAMAVYEQLRKAIK
jgi:hypothetical protein